MFGKRGNDDGNRFKPEFRQPAPAPAPVAPAAAVSVDTAVLARPAATPQPSAPVAPPARRAVEAPPMAPEPRRGREKSETYYDTKSQVFSALIDTIDLSQLAKLDPESAREEIRDIVNDIIAIKNFAMSIAEQEELLEDICNDVLGYGPLEPLLARDDIADIMVNGSKNVYIEVNGKVEQTGIRFRDNQQLLNICQRIVSQVGRRVDESSPICDARLPDGSRVNVIAPPLAIDGTALTIRKFKKDKLTLDQLVKFGAISPQGAEVLKIIGRVRCNIVISGGTGSGKTTLLNCLTNYIDRDERVITCEDSAELQLQQPHVVRLETRPPNLEGEGEVTMRDLVKNCLRMRPERIIVGEVRGPEVFDLLQAMNTGHDGSMGTIHSNSPRECLNRIESMIAMGGYSLPQKTVREIVVGSIDVIIQAARLRDGSRRITHITEVIGMEGDVIITQDIVLYNIKGEDANGRLLGEHVSTGIGRPHFWERARYYGEEQRLATALEAMEKRAD
ncbi:MULTISPECIES: CpaF family protein [unclassified Mesorhizobium]|uniref:CpaF family protein n=1 Tax=unclassified Mesorhizobium TaxID=325217 RepID=UPI000FD78F4A|nr:MULTISPECIES: CpaF family protein [unclassified Mesorhizobium]RWC73589.1 MAG: CpaF family protein [Mesorhizobium sp.]TGR38360.1 CpaF family protein [bacterium M00.F.Ca.ET.199.01.1.1]TGU26647.1 CpaF family protein [bacterium M00.F.Ca.ET.156.01.1.1]TGV83367.1 CpaF family protein [Mesorhizobium sp. M00.F.Ca.ET.149.01.1.1]TGQ01503.1 CpaF family protein [Mesorhizobium sp. M8A.F.Ca.ET.218.01.1.1]